MAGLINTMINKRDPLAQVKGYDASTVNLDDDDTVLGQFKKVRTDSVLDQQAEGQTRSDANKRGLVNSNMRVMGKQDTLNRIALPIASQDSATRVQNKQFNATSTNTANQFTAGETNRAALQERSGQQAVEQIGTQGDVNSRLQKEQFGYNTDLEKLRAANESQLQTSLQVLRGTQAVEQISARGSIDKSLQSQSDTAAMDRQKVSGEQTLTQQSAADKAAAERLATSGEQSLVLQSAADKAASERLQTSGTQTLEQIDAQGAKNVELENIRAANNETLEGIRSTNDRLISANQAAGLLFSNTQIAISNVLGNPEIPLSQKQQLIDTITAELDNGLTAIGTFSDVDVSGLLPETANNTASGNGAASAAPASQPAPYQFDPSSGVPGAQQYQNWLNASRTA